MRCFYLSVFLWFQVLICSAFIPFYCGILPPKHKGVVSIYYPISAAHATTSLAHETGVSIVLALKRN